MRIEWTLFAIERVEVLTEFLARKSPRAAARIIEDLLDRVAVLADQPELGPVLPVLQELDVRQMYFGAYRILYRVDRSSNTVFILAAQHGREARYSEAELVEILDVVQDAKRD